MALNPMQKKARNSFLLGMVITLLITSIIIAFLFMQVTQLKEAEDKLQKSYVTVCTLKTNVQSGVDITLNDIQETKVSNNMLPADRLTKGDFAQIISEGDVVAKIDIAAGTVLTQGLIELSSEQTTDDVRLQEYNMIVLPTQLEVDDYIDIRWQLPNGQDYIVASKKRVVDCNEDTIWIKVSEDEILTLSGAVVEAYITTGSKLYAIKYTEPGNQKDAVATYVPSSEVIALLNSDSNITDKAKAGLIGRYTQGLRQERENNIQKVINQYSDKAVDNVESKLEEEVARQKQARQEYLEQLDASSTLR